MFMITSLFYLRQHFFMVTSWFLFKILAITVWTESTEPFTVYTLPLVWKLLSSFFKITKSYGVITIHFPLT